MLILNIFTM